MVMRDVVDSRSNIRETEKIVRRLGSVQSTIGMGERGGAKGNVLLVRVEKSGRGGGGGWRRAVAGGRRDEGRREVTTARLVAKYRRLGKGRPTLQVLLANTRSSPLASRWGPPAVTNCSPAVTNLAGGGGAIGTFVGTHVGGPVEKQGQGGSVQTRGLARCVRKSGRAKVGRVCSMGEGGWYG